MWKRMLIMLAVMTLLISGIGYLKYQKIQAGMAMKGKFAPPPTAVTTLTVKAQSWQPVLSAVGSLKAVQGVTVSTDLPGIVSEILFQSGAPVKKDDVLVQFDIKQESAQLQSAAARLDLARTNLERNRELVAKKAIAASEFDASQSQFREATAALDECKALISRKRITAPFDGVLGIRVAQLGQYLNAGAPIVPLQALDPIYVEFSLPQHLLAQVALGKKLRLKPDGAAAYEAEVTAIDSRVDEATRSVVIQGTARNPEYKLKPGMFTNVEVLLPAREGVLAIPSSSISYAPYGDSVYVVRETAGPDGQTTRDVELRAVHLGQTRGDQVEILSGLRDGEQVVTSAVFKLRAGAPVQINNNVMPSNELQPKPEDS